MYELFELRSSTSIFTVKNLSRINFFLDTKLKIDHAFSYQFSIIGSHQQPCLKFVFPTRLSIVINTWFSLWRKRKQAEPLMWTERFDILNTYSYITSNVPLAYAYVVMKTRLKLNNWHPKDLNAHFHVRSYTEKTRREIFWEIRLMWNCYYCSLIFPSLTECSITILAALGHLLLSWNTRDLQSYILLSCRGTIHVFN